MQLLRDIVDYIEANAETIAITLATVLGIFIASYIAAKMFSKAAGRAVRRGHDMRRKTLAPIIETLVFAVILGAGAIMALDEAGLNVATILAGAGIIGLAVGFGAQTLVKDCISGFFLILDGVIAEGDIAQIGDKSGTVERVGLRVTQVRSYNGTLWYVPNGTIEVVGNFTRGWMRAIIEVGLAYEQDVSKGLRVLEEVGAQWAADHPEIVLDPPEAQGVLGLNSSDVSVRLVVKVDNSKAAVWGAERELRKRVKAAFDASGVEIPFPRSVVYHRQEDGDGLRIVADPKSDAA